MGNQKKNKQTWGLGILAVLIGLLLSVLVSVRLCMTDSFFKGVSEQMNLGETQVRKVTGEANLAAYVTMMLETPGLEEAGLSAVMNDQVFRDFLYQTMRNYRDDLLTKSGTGTVSFDEVCELYHANENHFTELLGYHITEEDLERYQLIWWTLAITERSSIDYMRFDYEGILNVIAVVLSPIGFGLGIVLLAVIGLGVWKKYNGSFRGMGILGFCFWMVAAVDILLFAGRSLLLAVLNQGLGLKGNVVTFALYRFTNVMLVLGLGFLLLGTVGNVLCICERKSARKRREALPQQNQEERMIVIKKKQIKSA